MNLSQVATHCRTLAAAAGAAILEVYATDFDVDYKSDQSPLTLADRKANDIIVDGLREHYPDCAILSEEGADNLSRREKAYCFIVDPLDGTKEFVNRNGQFTVNIALARSGIVVAGVIYVPVTGETYYAWENGGAFRLNGSGEETRLQASDKLAELIFVGSKSHSGEKEAALLEAHADKIAATISAGSSLKGCMVASGQADVYYRYGLTCEWDTAAMQCIVEQAGGVFRQLDGSPMTYNRENTLNDKGFFAVNRTENIWL